MNGAFGYTLPVWLPHDVLSDLYELPLSPSAGSRFSLEPFAARGSIFLSFSSSACSCASPPSKGRIQEFIHWNMAFSAHLLYLCNAGRLRLCSKPRVSSVGWSNRRAVYSYCCLGNVKTQNNRRFRKYPGLLRSRRLSCWLESRFSDLSSWSLKICSVGGTCASIHEEKGIVEFRREMIMSILKSQFIKIAAMVACLFLVIPAADAVDALKTCTCLLKECRVELAKCIANPSCAANVACLQTCNNRPDETECQIKCGDLFENNVVDEFNECAVSRKKCVPRKSDVGDFPIPDPSGIVSNFNIKDFSGKWFITSGLNPTFDTFDCQLHEFHVESNKLIGNLTWRIRTPDGGFFTRSTVQRFVQDPTQPGILYNHDNEYLHYQDDWYILSSKVENKPDDYIFVYYRGRNDAWDGYGGAVVYTRSAVLPDSIVPELEKAARRIGRNFNKFIRTDNSCGPEPPLVERLEKTVEEGERTIVREVEEIEEEVEKLGKTEMTLLERLAEGFRELKQDEENFFKELSKEEMDLLSELKMEATEVEKLFGRALPLRKLR